MKNLIFSILFLAAFTACKKPAKPISNDQTNLPTTEVAKDSAVATSSNVAPPT